MAEPTIIDVGNGGQGDALLDPHHIRQTAKLTERAIRERWPVRDDVRKLVLDEMESIIKLSDNDRNKIGAAKVILAADGINAKREATDTPQLHLHGQIGITEVIVELPKAEQPKQIILEPHAVLPG